ncbi:MAG: hypothetical protein J6I49_01550 [Bacteroidales bacterium]|nr:hypothetical protein [Bacteroidales bacterium]
MKKSLMMLAMLMPTMLTMACSDLTGRKKSPLLPNPGPDAAVYAVLGKTMSDVLFNPQRVTVYTLKPKATPDSADFQVEPHWVRDSLIGQLTPQMIGVLQFVLIGNPQSYSDDAIQVRSPYFPALEFEFTQKKQTVHVIVSLSNFTWTVIYDDKRQFNYNYPDKELINRFCHQYLPQTNGKENKK